MHKAGTLENAKSLEPDAHIWLSSSPSWVSVPEGALSYDTQPTIPELIKKVAERRAQKSG